MEMSCGYVFAVETLIWVPLTGYIKPLRDKDDVVDELVRGDTDVGRAVANSMLLAAISLT